MPKNLINKIASNPIFKAEQLELFSNPNEKTFIQMLIEKENTEKISNSLTLRQVKRTERLFNCYKETSPEKFIESIKEGKKYGIMSSAILAESLGFNKFALDLFNGLTNMKGETNYKRLKCILNNEKIEDFIDSLSYDGLIYAGKIFLRQKRKEVISLISKKLHEKNDTYNAIAFNAYASNYEEATNYL